MNLQGDQLRDFLEQYAERIAPGGIWKQQYFYIGKYIPEKKLKFAELSFAKLEKDEIPLLLYVGTLYANKMDGFLLTTQNLHYRAILSIERKVNKNLFTTVAELNERDSDRSEGYGIGDQIVTRGSECIPLSEIGTVSFKPGKLYLNNSTVPSTVLYLDSLPFSYYLNQSREDIGVLNDLLGRLDAVERADTTPLPKSLPEPPQKPVWAFDGEELIWDASSRNIGCFFAKEKYGHYNTFITNARIVRIFSGGIKASGCRRQEKYFYTVELSEVRNRYIIEKFSCSLVLELQGGIELHFYAAPDNAGKLDKYIGKALERIIPVIMFEDPDEKFLFKERLLPYDGAFCSKEFWETMFGGVSMNARFCVTNKRLLFYHVDQVSGLCSGGNVSECSITAPVFKCIWLPLSGIASLSREKRGLSHITRLYIKKCAPAGLVSQSPVIPKIDHQEGEIKYDRQIDNIRGRSAVNFGKLFRLSKEDRGEVIDILRSLLPYQCFEGME